MRFIVLHRRGPDLKGLKADLGDSLQRILEWASLGVRVMPVHVYKAQVHTHTALIAVWQRRTRRHIPRRS
jgi:hypothetical protein